MMPIALRITRFRSFKETQTFTFPERAGLYFMQGVNEVEPRLQANGAGKTTIWEALTWLWFGKLSTGLKAGDICNWDSDEGTKVQFDYMIEGEGDCLYTLTRTWKPNTWTLLYRAEHITNEEAIDLTKH